MENSLPSYLTDIFDKDELDEIEREKQELLSDRDFWKYNKTELVKRRKRVASEFEFNYTEPKRATERLEELGIDSESIKYVCSKSLFAFAAYYFPHYLQKKSSKFHRFLYRTLESYINTKAKWAIAAPRGNAKSSLVSGIFPLWCICYNKKKFIIILSDTAGQAEDFLSDVKRELEGNELLQRDFPFACGKGEMWRSDEIITKNNIKVLALGSGNKIRGRKFGTYRPDLILLDDIESPESVKSESERTSLRNDWFNKDVLYAGSSSAVSDDSNTDFFFVGTILGPQALLSALINPQEYPDWKSKKFKAVLEFSTSSLWEEWAQIYKNHFDPDREDNARTFFEKNEAEMLEGVEVLWPEGDPYYGLMIDRLRDPRGFAQEKQNIAIDPGSVYVTKEDLHWADFSKPLIKQALSRAVRFGALDPSLGKKRKRGDPSAIVTLARDRNTGIIFVEDMNSKLRSVDEQIDDILEFHEEFRYKLFGVETVAFQQVVADALKKKSRELGIYVPIKEIQTHSDKKLRFEAVVPFLRDGTIVFDKSKYETNHFYNLAVEEITSFTGGEMDEHDDVADAIGYAFDLAHKPKFKMICKSTR